MAEWSNAGDRLLFTVAAKGGDGLYDMYTMKPDGTEITNITPSEWPVNFLCSHGIYSRDDSKIYFVGEWWETVSAKQSLTFINSTKGLLHD
jgi:hypothetical protein